MYKTIKHLKFEQMIILSESILLHNVKCIIIEIVAKIVCELHKLMREPGA